MQYASLFQLLDQVPHEELKSQYLHLLGYLSIAPDVPLRVFLDALEEIRSQGDIQVAYTLENGKCYLHGSAKILYETKISHGCKKVGHIEDVVVLPNQRNQGIAQTLLRNLITTASITCYKVIMDCKEELLPLYEKGGFRKSGLHLEHRFL
jgi:glucosamine-phosphate N-acetyltransferase